VIEIENAAEPLAPHDRPVVVCGPHWFDDQSVVESLMIALAFHEHHPSASRSLSDAILLWLAKHEVTTQLTGLED